MTIAIWLAFAFVCFASAMHIVSIAIVSLRARQSKAPLPSDDSTPVTILKPVCGIENSIERTLRSTFELDWANYEVIFCCASEADPVVPVVKRLIAENPNIPAKLLTGDDRISVNPKLNNLVKGWKAAAHPWIIMSDSNVLLPRDYVTRLMAHWRSRVGLICSPPVGGEPEGFPSELECAFLNSYQARWQIAADSVGMGFAQGKTMLWRREVLDNAGGIPALARETAEDAAATKVVRGAGYTVRLDPGPFIQPLGRRDWRSVWNRQVRWARLRRSSFKQYFVLEVISGGFAPIAATGFLAATGSIPLLAPVAFAAVWYSAEVLLARLAGWHLSARSLPAFVLRDLLIPPLWVLAWTGNSFNWRGNAMRIERTGDEGRPGAFNDLAMGLIRGNQPLSALRVLPATLTRKLRSRNGRGGSQPG